MRALAAAVIVFGLAVSSAGAGVQSSKPGKYVLPSVAFNASIGVVSAVGGSYVVQGKKQPVKFAYQYSLADQAGNSCGATSLGSGRSFALKLNPYRLQARFGLKRAGSTRLAWGKWRVFTPGGIGMQCGSLASTTLPPTDQLCAWSDQNQGFTLMTSGTACGVPPPGACAWSSPATFVNGVYTVGTVSCPHGPCNYRYINQQNPITWWSTPIEEAEALECPDGSFAPVGAFVIRLGHYDSNHQLVIDCQHQTDGVAVLRFTIPSDIGGVLQVDSLLWPFPSHTGPSLVQHETQTSQFNLGGSQSGCPLNLPSINRS